MALNAELKLIPLERSWRKANALKQIPRDNLPRYFFKAFEPQTIAPIDFPPIDVFQCKNTVLLSHARLSRRINLLCDSNALPIEIGTLNLDYVIGIYKQVKRSADEHEPPLIPTTHRVVSKRCVLLAGWDPRSWGHFLIEYLPRLLLLKKYFRTNEVLPICISEATPGFIISAMNILLREYNPQFIFFEDNTLTLFEDVIVPPYINYGDQRGYHPFLSLALEEWIGETITPINGDNSEDKVYISRKHNSHSPTTPQRPIVNEDELIERLVEAGFKIVAMEELDIIEKLKVMSSAKLVIGGLGSGTHNSLLSTSYPSVVSLGLGFSNSQDHVCDIKNQAYFQIPTFEPTDKTKIITRIGGKAQYVNIDNVLSAVEHVLKRRESPFNWQLVER
jgi:capsular polysaccharide biosynthesis protein